MARELELKAVVSDPAALRERLLAAGAVARFLGRMTDVRYDRGAELAARDHVLRVRTYHHRDGRLEEVLAWKGPTLRSPEGYKLREEIELTVASGTAGAGQLLVALGYQPVHAIEREVEIYALGAATARVEVYPRMDVLLEIEGDPASIERTVAATGIPREHFTADPLTEFVRRYEARSGRSALLSAVPPGTESG